MNINHGHHVGYNYNAILYFIVRLTNVMGSMVSSFLKLGDKVLEQSFQYVWEVKIHKEISSLKDKPNDDG